MRNTADALGEVEADDNFRYHIKGDAHGRFVRASEWLCTLIAEEIGIAAPTPMVIQRIDGSLVFGSRRISGVAEETATRAYLAQPSNSNLGAPPVGLRPLLSAIYALDLFIFNDDRHLGNYLSIDDQGTRRLYTFDFSRAMFWDWPWNGVPPVGSNTRMVGRLMRMLHGFDPVAAATVLDRIEGLPLATVEGFVKRMPEEWLPVEVRREFLAFWGGQPRPARVEELRRGFGDGSIL
ncbi:HipA family kinase [Methylorubrum thiocyanatum]